MIQNFTRFHRPIGMEVDGSVSDEAIACKLKNPATRANQ